MGLASLWGIDGRALFPLSPQRLAHPANRRAPGVPRTVVARDLQELHGQLRSAGPYLPRCRGTVPKGTCALRRQFQLLAFPTQALRRFMKKISLALSTLLLMASAAQAEIRSINITVFGMD